MRLSPCPLDWNGTNLPSDILAKFPPHPHRESATHLPGGNKSPTAMKRAIHVIPDTSKAPWIETFRQQFDPLYDKIKAHLTLVFPFDLPLSDPALIQHCQQAAGGIAPFSITLTGFHRSPDDHLWLTVGPSDPLSLLTNNLHTGPLGSPSTARRSDSHHITIARPPLPPDILTAAGNHESQIPITLQITSYILERILPDQSSLELGTFHLRS